MTARPLLRIIAGPNGAGKSTLTRTAGIRSNLIDPDAIARALNPSHPTSAAGMAGREALARAARYLDQRANFAQETTMSGNSTLRLIRQANAAGYEIDMRYVCVIDPVISMGRIATRVDEGGHAIPVEDVKRRFARSLAALPDVLCDVNTATFYDNSERSGHRIVASFADGQFTSIASNAPAWAQTSIAIYQENQS